MYSIDIGKVHPSFFKHSGLFRKFHKSVSDEGVVFLQSPHFTLRYMFSSGVLTCEDSEVLLDFANLISEHYGTSLTREQVKSEIVWGTVVGDWSVLNVGVVILSDSDIGWDGSVNAMWFDSEVPGVLVSVNYQFWSTLALHGAWKLSKEDVINLGGDVVLPNLVDALVIFKKDSDKHSKIEHLIASVCL